jgi:hypothetical protein
MVMEFLYGLTIGLLVAVIIWQRKPKKQEEPIEDEKQKEFEKHFEGLLNYDAHQAYRGRK